MSSPVKILAVDDEPEITEIIEQYLNDFGFHVTTADSAEAARRHLASDEVDILILDVNMPGEDGVSLAASLRGKSRPAVLMLTALTGLDDRLRGLTSGADDYVAKPFEPRELLARVRSLVRRLPDRANAGSAARDDDKVVAFGRFRLDLKSHGLFDEAGREIPLTAMEFDLLKAFAEHPNRILNRDQLADFGHQRDWSPDDRSIDIRIARLRKKIESDPKNPEWIETVRGLGYRFNVRLT